MYAIRSYYELIPFRYSSPFVEVLSVKVMISLVFGVTISLAISKPLSKELSPFFNDIFNVVFSNTLIEIRVLKVETSLSIISPSVVAPIQIAFGRCSFNNSIMVCGGMAGDNGSYNFV